MVDGKTGGAFFALKAKRDERDGKGMGSGWKVDGKGIGRWMEGGWEVDEMGSFYINKKKCCFICIYANFFVPLQPK